MGSPCFKKNTLQPSVCLQMLDEAGYAKEGRIAVTQPRRVVRFCAPLHVQNEVVFTKYAGRT